MSGIGGAGEVPISGMPEGPLRAPGAGDSDAEGSGAAFAAVLRGGAGGETPVVRGGVPGRPVIAAPPAATDASDGTDLLLSSAGAANASAAATGPNALAATEAVRTLARGEPAEGGVAAPRMREAQSLSVSRGSVPNTNRTPQARGASLAPDPLVPASPVLAGTPGALAAPRPLGRGGGWAAPPPLRFFGGVGVPARSGGAATRGPGGAATSGPGGAATAAGGRAGPAGDPALAPPPDAAAVRAFGWAGGPGPADFLPPEAARLLAELSGDLGDAPPAAATALLAAGPEIAAAALAGFAAKGRIETAMVATILAEMPPDAQAAVLARLPALLPPDARGAVLSMLGLPPDAAGLAREPGPAAAAGAALPGVPAEGAAPPVVGEEGAADPALAAALGRGARGAPAAGVAARSGAAATSGSGGALARAAGAGEARGPGGAPTAGGAGGAGGPGAAPAAGPGREAPAGVAQVRVALGEALAASAHARVTGAGGEAASAGVGAALGNLAALLRGSPADARIVVSDVFEPKAAYVLAQHEDRNYGSGPGRGPNEQAQELMAALRSLDYAGLKAVALDRAAARLAEMRAAAAADPEVLPELRRARLAAALLLGSDPAGIAQFGRLEPDAFPPASARNAMGELLRAGESETRRALAAIFAHLLRAVEGGGAELCAHAAGYLGAAGAAAAASIASGEADGDPARRLIATVAAGRALAARLEPSPGGPGERDAPLRLLDAAPDELDYALAAADFGAPAGGAQARLLERVAADLASAVAGLDPSGEAGLLSELYAGVAPFRRA